MKRFGFLVQAPWFTMCLGLVIVVTRGVASTGQTASRFPDSIGYETFSLFGQADRSWPVTAVYALVQSDSGRVFVQAIIGSLAWLWLGSELARDTRWPRLVLLATALLSLSPQIVRYDVAILSESLGISFAVLAVAATLRQIKKPSRLSTIVWISCVATCGMTRPTHLLVIAACCVPYVHRLLKSRGRQLSAAGVTMCAVLVFGVLQQRNASHVSLLNLYTVVSSRVISDDRRFEWFIDRGMPNVPGMRTATGYDYAGDLPPDVAAAVNLPGGQQPPALMRVGGVDLAEWMKDNGWRTLIVYLATHPGDSLSHARNLLDSALNPPNGDFLPLSNGPMIPGVFYGAWQVWTLCALAGILLMWFRSRRISLVFMSMLAVVSAVYLVTVHTSGIEHVRHSVTVAAMIRIIGLCAIVSALAPGQIRRTPDEDVSAQK